MRTADKQMLVNAANRVLAKAIDGGLNVGVHSAESILLLGIYARLAEAFTSETFDVKAMRANLHATFNGGWRDKDHLRAFHHGMDAVCNVLDAHQNGEQTNWILPRQPEATKETR